MIHIQKKGFPHRTPDWYHRTRPHLRVNYAVLAPSSPCLFIPRNKAINYKSDPSVSRGKTSRDARFVSYPPSLLYRQMLNVLRARISYLRRLPFKCSLLFLSSFLSSHPSSSVCHIFKTPVARVLALVPVDHGKALNEFLRGRHQILIETW